MQDVVVIVCTRSSAGRERHLLAMVGILLFAAAPIAFAQSIVAAGTEIPRVVAIFLSIDTGDAGNTGNRTANTVGTLLSSSLFQAIRAAVPDLKITELPGVGGDLSSRAHSRGADAWISVRVRFQNADDTGLSAGDMVAGVEYELFDLITNARTAAASFQVHIDPRLRNVGAQFWAPIAMSAATSLTPRDISRSVTVSAVPGTHLTIVNTKSKRAPAATVGAEGAATFSLPAPGTYRVTATNPDFYPIEKQFTLLDSSETVPLVQNRRSPWYFQLLMQGGSFPQLGASYLFRGDQFFVDGYLGGYLLALLPDSSNGVALPWATYPMVTPGLGGGLFITPPAGIVRLFVDASVFVRVEFPSNYQGIDPVIPGGVGMKVGIELLPNSPLRGVLALEPRLYYTPDQALALSSGYGTILPLFPVGSMMLFDAVTLYFGARFQPEAHAR